MSQEKKSEIGKKPIPGSWFLIIGSAMILMSVFIDVEKLLVFILTGAVFIVIGFFKTVMKIEEKKLHAKKYHTHQHAEAQASESKTVHYSDNKSYPEHKIEHHTTKTEHGTHKTTHTTASVCANCGVKLHPAFKFCPNCGHKLR